jgi:hypothetical protein
MKTRILLASGIAGAIFLSLVVLSLAATPPHDKTYIVTPDKLANCGDDGPALPTCKEAHKDHVWFFYNDVNDTIDNTIGSFVFSQYGRGPFYDGCAPSATCQNPPMGVGSVQISTVLNRRPNLATYQFGGTSLVDITTLQFSTYNPSAGNKGSSNRSGYLHFNVDFTGNSTNYQRRLVYVPQNNGPVTQDNWKAWDAINGGGANWVYSGPTWPAGIGSCTAPGSSTKTWAQILACYPNARILPGDSFLGIRVGEPYPDGYTENIDAFKFGTAKGLLTFDFEPIKTDKDDDDN